MGININTSICNELRGKLPNQMGLELRYTEERRNANESHDMYIQRREEKQRHPTEEGQAW